MLLCDVIHHFMMYHTARGSEVTQTEHSHAKCDTRARTKPCPGSPPGSYGSRLAGCHLVAQHHWALPCLCTPMCAAASPTRPPQHAQACNSTTGAVSTRAGGGSAAPENLKGGSGISVLKTVTWAMMQLNTKSKHIRPLRIPPRQTPVFPTAGLQQQ